jgi:hypothetical protein
MDPNANFTNNQGWIYKNGAYTFFNAPGADPNNQGTITYGENNAGSIVGYTIDTSGVYHGFERFVNGSFLTIDPPGTQGTQAGGINNFGVIDGNYLDASGTIHGFLLKNGVYTTFDEPGYGNTILTGINDRGQLVGFAWNNGGPNIGFVATPTPEPSALLLLGFGGLAGIVWARRRSR